MCNGSILTGTRAGAGQQNIEWVRHYTSHLGESCKITRKKEQAMTGPDFESILDIGSSKWAEANKTTACEKVSCVYGPDAFVLPAVANVSGSGECDILTHMSVRSSLLFCSLFFSLSFRNLFFLKTPRRP
jgi:hypothetical protein